MKTFINWLVENFTDAETAIANGTSRTNGAVGATALVPRHDSKK